MEKSSYRSMEVAHSCYMVGKKGKTTGKGQRMYNSCIKDNTLIASVQASHGIQFCSDRWLWSKEVPPLILQT